MSRFVYKMGQRIKTKIGSIEGFVTGVCMRSDVMYEISYFVSAEHKQIWLYEFEFEPTSNKKQAGFNRQQEDEPLMLDEFK